MNSYWNLSEKERSELTSDQVRSFFDVELMEKGVAKVPPPVLQDIEKIVIETHTYFEPHYRGEYSICGCGFCFETAEQAQEFLDLNPLKIDSRWQWGSDNSFAAPMRETSLVSVSLPTESVASASASVLQKNKSAEEANNKARSQYNEAIKAVKEATDGIWDDWNEYREKAARCKKVVDTRTEYLALCDGNAETAEVFLCKVFSDDDIAESKEWFCEQTEEAKV